MKTYKFNSSGDFIGFGEAQADPKTPGNYLYDDRAETLIAPNLPVTPGKRANWNGSEWLGLDIDQKKIDDMEGRAIVHGLNDYDLKQIRALAALCYSQAISKPEKDRSDDEKILIDLEGKKQALRDRKKIIDGRK
jgi:hypothetical protein